MAYTVEYEKKAIRQLSKLDNGTSKLIINWIEKNLINTDNPRSNGKSLKGDLKEYWRYRVGSYRIIAEINDNKLIILLVNIAHRKEVYK
ncbi:MAG: type II toxin-antitoxin system RelE/ParE family toxin [Miniphocaeibacter sp.]|uniref:type II toxin-antitoxin system RelE family toxin n=1 Tax=Miniphocaeibacter sp. TaxID=3100973 RepID=UPI0018046462|nr:type II toxin-antitoxin system RelE/ParE family toxin [Gallicola sp.]